MGKQAREGKRQRVPWGQGAEQERRRRYGWRAGPRRDFLV